MDRLCIINAIDAGNLSVLLTFSDNTTQLVNVGDFIRRNPHPQYNKYLDPRKFKHFTRTTTLILMLLVFVSS